MKSFFPRIGKSTILEAALGIVLLHGTLYTEDPPEVGFLPATPRKGGTEEEMIHNTPSLKALDKNKDTYTINFNNVAITEYIRFASKITNLNFIFNDADLQFNVTIVSEEPVTPRNIMSILIQVLRIHGLIVLEQDNNLLITNVRTVSQLATVVSSDLPDVKGVSPLVTRVFRIRNANLTTVAAVIKPMLSDSALLELSAETKQLIVTDITTNVDKISSLLASIDAPHTSLEIDSYVVQNMSIDSLIKLGTQLITPFSEGNPLTFVSQPETSTIYIVSTPYLIERALAVFEDLDVPAKERKEAALHGQTVFLYKLMHKQGDDFISGIRDIIKQLKSRGASYKLIDCLDEAKWIKESNSILFIGDDETLSKVKELLPTLDTSDTTHTLPAPKSNVFVYKIQQADQEQLQNSLDALAEDMQKAPQPDYGLIDVLTSVKYIPEAHSLVFTGDTAALSKLADILPTFDQTTSASLPSQFLVYNPKNLPGPALEKSLLEIAKNLKDAGLADPLFLQSVKTVQWTPSTNSLLFTGTSDTLSRIAALLQSIDGGTEGVVSGKGYTFYLYKLKNASAGSAVIDSLKRIAANLKSADVPNQPLISTLENVKWMKDNNSLLITGNASSIEQARTLIDQFDVSAAPISSKTSFLIYKPVHQTPDVIESSVQDLGKALEGSGLADPDLLSTIATMKYVEATDSILFTGTPAALDKMKEILSRADSISTNEANIQQLGQSTFFIYKIQYTPATQLISSLKSLASDLQKTGTSDPGVVESINTLRYIKDTNSILFTGAEKTLQKVEAMVKKFDTPSMAQLPEGAVAAPSTFIVYTPKYQPGDDLIQILDEFQQNLVASGVVNRALFDTISNLKYVPRTCSILISGDPESIAKVDELLRRFDVPTAAPIQASTSIESIQNTSFLIYKLQYHQGSEILTALKQIATDLGPGTATGNQNLLNAINSLQWIRVTNSLLATGEADTLAKLRDLVQNLDVPLRQVFIEILVIETSLTNTQNFGLQWGGKMQYLNKFAASTGNFPVPAANSSIGTALAPSGTATGNFQTGIQNTNASTAPAPNNIPFLNGFDLGVIGDIIMNKGKSYISLGNLVNALQTDTDSTIIMNTKIITQDNRTSTLFVGNNIPFIGSLVTTSAQIINSSSNIEYRDIGFNLSITPTIGNSNIVTMDISNDISEVINTPSIGSVSSNNTQSTITGITSSHTAMATRVHVPDQHFVILTGMVTNTKTRFKSGVPCLGGLPVIGLLFQENDRLNSKANIIIFVRPHVVNTYEEYKAITNDQENVFKDNAVMPVLKEEFDDAIDMVKKPTDD